MSGMIERIMAMICRVISIANKKLKLTDRTHVMQKIIEFFEKDNKSFFTYHLRPMESESIDAVCRPKAVSKKLGIVLQGPLLRENDFTIETIKIYQKLFCGASLVVSTWEGEDNDVISKLRASGVEVLLNPQPEYRGQSNINLQIVSSGNGVRKAQELGVEYVMKTRTDQRIYAPNAAEFLFNITELFPVGGGYDKQKKRIVGISHNTFKYRMYGLSDMLTFGHVDDMLLYWDAALDNRVFSDKEIEEAVSSLKNFALWRVCEVYLATEFLMKVGRKLEWTLTDSWQAFADHFYVVDKEQLDLFWPKYNRLEYRWRNYTDKIQSEEMTSRDWVNIYAGLNQMEVPEHLLRS